MKSKERLALERRAKELGYDAEEDDTDGDLVSIIRQREESQRQAA